MIIFVKLVEEQKRDLSRILGAHQGDIRQMASLNRKISKFQMECSSRDIL